MKIPYLVKGNNLRYYFRIIVPKSARSQVGRREIRRSLKTTDIWTAVERCYRYAEYYKKYFETMAIHNGIRFSDMVVTKTTSPDGTTTEKIELDPENLEAEKQLLREYKATTHTTTPQQNAPLLSEVIKAFVDEKTTLGKWKQTTANESIRAYEVATTFLGDRPIDTISRYDATTLLKTFKKLPNANGEKLSPKTVNGRIGMLSSLFTYAVNNDLCTKNPFKGLQQKKTTRADQERDIYTTEELSKLFDAQHFTPDTRRPARYWIPVFMLYTGARPGELAQLTIDDFTEVDGVRCVSISEEHNVKTKHAVRNIPLSKELFTLGLDKFLDETRRKNLKDTRLFTDLNPRRPKPAGAVSSWWNTTHHKRCKVQNVTRIGTTRKRKVSLYSLRHGVQTMLRNAKIPETFCDELVGHKKGGMSYGRYAKSSIVSLVEAIETLHYTNFTITTWPK